MRVDYFALVTSRIAGWVLLGLLSRGWMDWYLTLTSLIEAFIANARLGLSPNPYTSDIWSHLLNPILSPSSWPYLGQFALAIYLIFSGRALARLLVRDMAPQQACTGCGYDLSGLSPGGACPECGKPAAAPPPAAST